MLKKNTSVKTFEYPDYLCPNPYTGKPIYGGSTFEVSHSEKKNSYGIEFRYGYVKYSLSLSYKGMDNGRYVYAGFEIGNMTEAVVMSSTKLSRFLNNYGQVQNETFEKDKLIEVHISGLGSLSVYPIKDIPERRKKTEEVRLRRIKQAEEDSIRKATDIELLKSYLLSIDTIAISDFIKQYEIDFYKIRENRVGDSSYDFNTQKRVKYLLQDEVTSDYKLLLYINSEECKPVQIDSEVLDKELYGQYNPHAESSYTLNGTTYNKIGTGFFFKRQFKHRMLCGRHIITIKKNKSEIVYYKGTGFYKTKVQEKDLPLVVLNKIQSDITERGTYVIDYIFVNDSILRFSVHK